MSIWGKLIGGATGLALGGPLGAILGIAAGHGVDKASNYSEFSNKKYYKKEEKEEIFASSVIALAAKISKADGIVSEEEIRTFKKLFEFSKEDEGGISKIFNAAKKDISDFKLVAKQVFEVFQDERSLLLELLNSLFAIAYADGHFHEKEKSMLLEISKIFNINTNEFNRINNIHISKNKNEIDKLQNSYEILGVSKNWDFDQIKKRYNELVKEYHPDRLQGMGLPKDFVELANDKLRIINAAYNEIKTRRK